MPTWRSSRWRTAPSARELPGASWTRSSTGRGGAGTRGSRSTCSIGTAREALVRPSRLPARDHPLSKGPVGRGRADTTSRAGPGAEGVPHAGGVPRVAGRAPRDRDGTRSPPVQGARGARGLTYAQALDEALCFGWIDGVVHRLDEDSFRQRYSPRQPRSNWSRRNIEHVERLKKAGRMTPAGLAAYEARDAHRTGVYSFEQERPELRLCT